MTNVARQTSPPKRTQPQNYVITTEQPPGNQARNEPVPFLSYTNNCFTDVQESEEHTTTAPTEDITVPHLTITTPLIEE